MNYKRKISDYLGYRTDPTRVAVALLAGLAVGAILGVLFAPESGEETRGRISDKAKGLANDAKDRFQSVKGRFRTDVEKLAEIKSEAVKTAKSKAKNVADDINTAADKAKAKAKNISVDQNGSIQGI